ncbi:MAG: hypothetical protein ABI472_20130 [Ginsengibacter sp.]
MEKDIKKKGHAINEKFGRKIKNTEKSLQKQLDYIEKKYENKGEKDIQMNELKRYNRKSKS